MLLFWILDTINGARGGVIFATLEALGGFSVDVVVVLDLRGLPRFLLVVGASAAAEMLV